MRSSLVISRVPFLVCKITYWCLVGNGWEWRNGMIIASDYGSFPHSLLSTSKISVFVSSLLRKTLRTAFAMILVIQNRNPSRLLHIWRPIASCIRVVTRSVNLGIMVSLILWLMSYLASGSRYIPHSGMIKIDQHILYGVGSTTNQLSASQ